ncbi:MAG: hypothetical protein JXB18_07270 [Sedimentisphaerales bacterium]|nr:hypothetical protein [Sedimentisphaerales bacterium]
MKQFLCGVIVVVIAVLVMGNASNQSENGKFQIVTSNTFSDVFVLDTSSGVLYRYAFVSPRGNSTGKEVIFVETYGSPNEPAYKELQRLTGKEWANGLVY